MDGGKQTRRSRRRKGSARRSTSPGRRTRVALRSSGRTCATLRSCGWCTRPATTGPSWRPSSTRCPARTASGATSSGSTTWRRWRRPGSRTRVGRIRASRSSTTGSFVIPAPRHRAAGSGSRRAPIGSGTSGTAATGRKRIWWWPTPRLGRSSERSWRSGSTRTSTPSARSCCQTATCSGCPNGTGGRTSTATGRTARWRPSSPRATGTSTRWRRSTRRRALPTSPATAGRRARTRTTTTSTGSNSTGRGSSS